MGTFNYTALLNTADRLISKFGRDITLVKQSSVAAVSAQPWRGPANTVTTTVTVSGVMVGDQHRDSDGLVRRGEVDQILIAAKATTEDLTTFHKANIDGKLRDIESVELIRPGDTALLYILTVLK